MPRGKIFPYQDGRNIILGADYGSSLSKTGYTYLLVQMKQINRTSEPVQIKKLLGRYNMVANLFWSGLNLIPLYVFCYTRLPSRLLYFFIIASLLTLLIPAAFFNNLPFQISKSTYRKIGLRFVNRFTQNGTIINALVRRKYPRYKTITPGINSVKHVWKQTFLFEKFHFMFFLFFVLTGGYALLNGYIIWFLVISFNNLLYNVYPVFLQHYIRSRLRSAKLLGSKPPG